jgi:ribosomal protein S12 methylthiotransferase
MNRGVTDTQIKDIIHNIRGTKHVSIRTTLIAGFPEETEEEFMELFNFIKQTRFDWVGVFPYYCEHGTAAAMLKQLPARTVNERYEKLISLQSEIMQRRNAQRIGKTYKTLMHSHDGVYKGHTSFAAPDIDGHVVCCSKHIKVGQFYKLRISRTTGCNFHGTLQS